MSIFNEAVKTINEHNAAMSSKDNLMDELCGLEFKLRQTRTRNLPVNEEVEAGLINCIARVEAIMDKMTIVKETM